MENNEKNDYGLVIFKAGTPLKAKRRGLFFFTALSLIILCQACYWVFANSVEPIILGMPFGMFTVVALIVLEFITLMAMYLTESEKGDAK